MKSMFLALAACALQATQFDFVHVSDTHVEARAAGSAAPATIRGEETFDWIVRALAVEGAQPELVLATGDLTEFGAPGDTWSDVERLFAKLPMPWYPVAGNHDRTWNPIDGAYRAKLADLAVPTAGLGYVVKRDTWALGVLSSATLHEPLPSFDPLELSGMSTLLEKSAWRRALLLAMHHAPDSAEFAQPFSARMLFDALDGLDIELILYGHGHAAETHRVFGVDCVQGGSTFASKAIDERGFGRITGRDGRLRASYRYLDPERSERVLVDKSIRAGANTSREVLSLDAPRTASPESTRVDARWTPKATGFGPESRPWRLFVDGERVEDPAWTAHDSDFADVWTSDLAALGIAPGLHLVSLEVELADGRMRQQSTPLVVPSGSGQFSITEMMWRPADPFRDWYDVVPTQEHRPPSAVFGSRLPGNPLRISDVVYIGDSDGTVRAIDVGTAGVERVLWTTEPIGMAIEAAPALAGGLLVVGAWDGSVHAFDARTGDPKWSKSGPKSSEGGAARYFAPADCSPVVLQDRIYVCDRGYRLAWYSMAGEMHVLPHANVAAISASADGTNLYLRGIDDVLTRIDRDGAAVWSTHVPLGRIPVPPIETHGVVHVVSDQGLWSRVDANSGTVVATIPTSATAYVFEPPVLGDDGSVTIHSQGGIAFHWQPEVDPAKSPR